MTAPSSNFAALSIEDKLAAVLARSRSAAKSPAPSVVVPITPAVRQAEAGPGLMRCELHGVYRQRIERGRQIGCVYCADDALHDCTHTQAVDRARATLETRMHSVGLFGRFCAATFDNFTAATAEQRAVLTACHRFVNAAQKRAGAGLMLVGPCGTGKTHLLAAMARELVFERCVGAVLTTPRAIVRRLRATWAKSAHETEDDVIADLSDRLEVLLLDEAGVGFGSDAELTQLFEVIDRRYALERPTVVASNLNAKELRAALGDRIFDRLREGAQVLVLDWASHRGGAGAAQ
jgi:DNA replication protein DnaC